MDASRRAFLKGRPGERQASPQRPPWALAEPEFLARCIHCNACVHACPTGLLVQGEGGYPQVDFSVAHCTFCGDCRKACQSGALSTDSQTPPWHLLAQVDVSCLPVFGVTCRTCGDRCDAGAIRFSPRMGGPAIPWVDASLCTGCGECVADCPARSISMVPAASVSVSSPEGVRS